MWLHCLQRHSSTMPRIGTPPKAIVLDVNGTLFPASAAAPAFKELGLDPVHVDAWFASVLRDALAIQTAKEGAGSRGGGEFVSFAQLGAYHLARLLGEAGIKGVDPEDAMRSVARAWREAAMFPDIPPALRRLAAAGIKVSVLTNGSVEVIAGPLVASNGLEGVVTTLLDVSMAQAWKTSPTVYRFAAERLGCAPSDVMMVASHPWDIHGALSAGLRGAYVMRCPSEPHPPYLLQPDCVVPDFAELADVLVGRAGL